MSVVKSTSISVGQVGHDAVFMRKACQWYWQTLTKSNNIQTSFCWTLGFQNCLGCRGCYAYSQSYQALFSCPIWVPLLSLVGLCPPGVKRRHGKAEKMTWSDQQRQSIYSSERMSKVKEILNIDLLHLICPHLLFRHQQWQLPSLMAEFKDVIIGMDGVKGFA